MLRRTRRTSGSRRAPGRADGSGRGCNRCKICPGADVCSERDFNTSAFADLRASFQGLWEAGPEPDTQISKFLFEFASEQGV